jgi:hypothetical protein
MINCLKVLVSLKIFFLKFILFLVCFIKILMQKGHGRVQREERGPNLTKERKVLEKLLLKRL